MTYTTKEVREENGDLVISFSFANGKTVDLRAKEYASGKAMVEAAKQRALEA